MTYEEAANILDPVKRESALLKYDSFERLGKLKEACQVAAEMLRKCGQNATEIKPDCNHPLTLEQLREMERPTPVWTKIKNKTVEGWAGYWCLCCHGNILTPGHISMYAGKMEGVEFYLYPLAHIDREAWTAEWKDHYRSGIKVGSGFVCSSCDMWNGEQSDICPYCGRAMSEHGFSKLEKRLRGVR